MKKSFLSIIFAIILLLPLSACGSSGTPISENSLVSAFAAQKNLKIQMDVSDQRLFYGLLGKDIKFFNAHSLAILFFSSNDQADSKLNLAIKLIENYVPGEQIFKCKNLIGQYNIKYEEEIKKIIAPWCSTSDHTLNIYPEKPFLGFLTSYSYEQTGNGLYGIVNNLKTGGYRIDFYQADKKQSIDYHLDYATFTEQGGGLVKVLWNSGETNIAPLSLDGIDFECSQILSKNFDIPLSRGDCMLHNADEFRTNIELLSSLNGNRWENLEVAAGNPGLFVVFTKLNANQSIATLYQQAQNGSVGEVTTATMTDLGFGSGIGEWDDGTKALFSYNNFTPVKKISSAILADAKIHLNCVDDEKAMVKPDYVNSDSCTFYSIHKAASKAS